MKRSKMCSGQGFDSPQVHHKEIQMEKYTQRDWDRLVGIGTVPEEYQYESLYDGPVLDFDRASSSQVDSGVGDDSKSSKSSRRKRLYIRTGRLSHAGVVIPC